MSTIDSTSYIFSPVYLEYACLVVAMVVSAIVLGYEMYLFVKECMAPKEEEKKKLVENRLSVENVEGEDKNATMENIAIGDDTYNKGMLDYPVENV
jgi:hypothetical protein